MIEGTAAAGLLFLLLISGLIFGFIGVAIAKNKGIGAGTGFLLGALLGPLGLIVVALLNPPVRRASPISGDPQPPPQYTGDRDVTLDRYRLWLVQKYGIERNETLNRYVVGLDSFTSLDEALSHADHLDNEETRRREADAARAAEKRKADAVRAAEGRKRDAIIAVALLVCVALVIVVIAVTNSANRRAAQIERNAEAMADEMEVRADQMDLAASGRLASAEPAPVPTLTAKTVAVPSAFSLPSLPSEVDQLQCHMDDCYWQQISRIDLIRTQGNEALLKVTGRQGSSHHQPTEENIEAGTQYPEHFGKDVELDWEPSVGYVLCSHRRPATAVWSKEKRHYGVDYINPANLFGVNTAAGQLYMKVCHGLKPGQWDKQDIARLDYTVTGDGEQTTVRSLNELLP